MLMRKKKYIKKEDIWVKALTIRLNNELSERRSQGFRLSARPHFSLPYLNEILSYTQSQSGKVAPEASNYSKGYVTDILISEHATDETWTPRVVIEVSVRSNPWWCLESWSGLIERQSSKARRG